MYINLKYKSVSIKDSIITLNNEPCTINGLCSYLKHSEIIQLYNQAIESLDKFDKHTLNGLSFHDLTLHSNNLISIRHMLRSLRLCNASSYGMLGQSISEQIGSKLGAIFGSLDYERLDLFSYPERSILFRLSDNYIGSNIDSYDLNNSYDPINDDESKAIAIGESYAKYAYLNYVSLEIANEIKNHAAIQLANHFANVESFRRFKLIAGNDLPNWGSHKWHAQSKKHNIPCEYCMLNWGNELSKSMSQAGIKIGKPKESKIDRLKSFYKQDKPLSQTDYISLIKASSPGAACEIIAKHLNADHAVSLLDAKTKALSKLIDDRGVYESIIHVIASDYNPNAFKKWLAYCNSNSASDNLVTSWEILFKHADCISNEEFLSLIESGPNLRHTDIPEQFYKHKLASLPDTHKYKLNDSITHAILSHMTRDEKKDWINNYIHVPKVVERLTGKRSSYASIDWQTSAPLFLEVDYASIRPLIYSDGKISPVAKYFIPAILLAKDNEAAFAYTKNGSDYSPNYELANLLSFEQKLAVLTTKGDASPHQLFNKDELLPLAKLAISDKNLYQYIDQLPLNTLNQNVEQAHDFFLPLTENVLKKANKATILKGLKHRAWCELYSVTYLWKDLYKRITRAEFDSVIDSDITTHRHSHFLAHLMTEDEIALCVEANGKFVRTNIATIDAKHLAKYKNKLAFKELVGDRRNSRNDNFGNKLERRLKELDA